MTQPLMLDPRTDRLQNQVDDVLVEKMGCRDTLPKTAHAILELLFERHKAYLYRICLKRFGDQLGPEGVEELVSDAFWRLWKTAHLFKRSAHDDPDKSRRHVRAWLGQIANRLFLTRFRNQQIRSEEEMKPLPPDVMNRPLLTLSGQDAVVREGILKALNDRERVVLRASAQHYNVGSGKFELPDDEVAQLSQELSMLPVSLRQVRVRALRKLGEYIEKHDNTGHARRES